jgi:hypothetical protein
MNIQERDFKPQIDEEFQSFLPELVADEEEDDCLYLEDLNMIVSGGCNSPECDHQGHGEMYFHCRCNTGVGLEVSYKAGSGTLVVDCNGCGEPMLRVAVANRAAAS